MSRVENFSMIPAAWKVIALATFLYLFVLPSPGYSQSEEELEQQRAEREAAIQAQREAEARQNEELMRAGQASLEQFLNDGYSPPTPLSREAAQTARFADFRIAVPKFRRATTTLRSAIGSGAKVQIPLKDIATQTDILLKFLQGEKLKHPTVDVAEFKNYSPPELLKETLKSAEKISPNLNTAVRAEQQQVVTTKTLDFLFQLEGDLLRLKWLTRHAR